MEYRLDSDALLLSIKGEIDSNNCGIIEKKIEDTIQGKVFLQLVLDFKDLTYISSAGLRVLLKLKKKHDKLSIINVPNDVYEIFSLTGFDSIIDVKKALRKIDVAGCEIIGQGGNGTVYRLDDDKIVKLYNPSVSLAKIEKERQYAKSALIGGAPCVIAYDVVQCEDCYGIVFELLKSNTLSFAIKTHPERMDEYIEKYVAFAKELHHSVIKDGVIDNIKDVLRRRLDGLRTWCNDEEIALLGSLIEELPDSKSLIHGDLHPGNIMIQNDELVLIDMPEVTIGPSIWDLAAIYRDLISAPKGNGAANLERSVGLPRELISEIGYKFFKSYTGIKDDNELEKYFQKLALVYALNVVLYLGSGNGTAKQHSDGIINRLLRGVVIPNEKALRYILKSSM